jgi:hypothetical protein
MEDGAGSTMNAGPGSTALDRPGTRTVLAVAVSSPAGLATAIAVISTLRSDAQSRGGVSDSPGRSWGESS